MKKKLFVFLILFSFSFAQKTVTLATDPFPPFHSPEKADYGFFAEIVKEAFAIEDYQLNIEFVPWSRAMELGKSGDYDGILGALYSDDRTKSFLYSNPVFKYNLVLYTRKELATSKEEFKKLNKLKFGKVKNYYYPVNEEDLKNYSIIETNSIENNLNALINKRIDFIVECENVIDDLLNNKFEKYTDKINKIEVFEQKDFYILFSKQMKDSEKVSEDFNNGLKKIRNNGTYEKILKKYGLKK